MIYTLSDIQWAAEECERQRSGELSVAWMCQALSFARRVKTRQGDPSYSVAVDIGAIVEPVKNMTGLRRVEVYVRRVDGSIAYLPGPEAVPNLLDRLFEHGDELTPGEWFKEFEEIHPFRDGNGRTGAILYNWLNDTLDDPETAPDFWNPSHPNFQS